MANEINFSGKLPGEEVNGLKTHAKELLEDPRQVRMVIAVIDVKTTVIDHDKQTQRPQVRIRHIELVPDKDIAAASKIMGKALAGRTGADQLPFPHGTEVPLDFGSDDEFANSTADPDQNPEVIGK